MLTLMLVAALSQANDPSLDRRAATGAMSAITERWKNADADGIAGLFTDDGDVVTLAGGILEGRPAVRDFFAQSLSSNPESRFETVVDRARRLSGDSLLVDGRWRIVRQNEPAGSTGGVFTAVLVRRGDPWRFAALRTGAIRGGHTRAIGREAEF